MPRRNSTSDVIDQLLIGVLTVGAIGLSVAAPNSLIALEKPLGKILKGRQRDSEARRIAQYLKKQKLVQVTPDEDDTYRVTLTDRGVRRTRTARLEWLEIPDKKWDQKWRVVTFDIPEQHKTIRDYISRHLRTVGFKQLQRSVFIYPYPVDEFIAILRELFPEIENNLSYMLVEELDQHNKFVKQFANLL